MKLHAPRPALRRARAAGVGRSTNSKESMPNEEICQARIVLILHLHRNPSNSFRGTQTPENTRRMKIGLVIGKVNPWRSRWQKPCKATGGRSQTNGFETEDARRLAASQRAVREREKQALNLQRENILSQRTSSPARRQALEAALAQIEGQTQRHGLTPHGPTRPFARYGSR